MMGSSMAGGRYSLGHGSPPGPEPPPRLPAMRSPHVYGAQLRRRSPSPVCVPRARVASSLTLGRLDANALEELGVDEGQLNHLAQLADLLVQAAHVGVLDVARVLCLHRVHGRVDLARQVPHDRERRHVERDARALDELGVVNLVAAADDVPRPARRLDDEPVRIQLPQHLPNDLANALQSLQIVLRLVVVLFEHLGLLTH